MKYILIISIILNFVLGIILYNKTIEQTKTNIELEFSRKEWVKDSTNIANNLENSINNYNQLLEEINNRPSEEVRANNAYNKFKDLKRDSLIRLLEQPFRIK